MSDWLNSLPAVTYPELAKKLGIPVAAMQIVLIQLKEADTPSKKRQASADMLVRELNQYLPDGWELGEKTDFRRASAFAAWASNTRDKSVKLDPNHRARAVFDALKLLNPPKGWLPKSTGDSFVQEAFRRGWPDTP